MKTILALCVVGLAALSPVSAQEKTTITPDEPQKNGCKVTWLGQSFIYIVSSSGFRVAIDPFDNSTNRYPMPRNMTPDILLVSNERSDHNNTDIIENNPVIFRSSIGEGTNNGNGIIFKGVPAKAGEGTPVIGDKVMLFAFTLDGIRFLHLGGLGQKTLTQTQLKRIGAVDVVFVPVGTGDFEKIVQQLKPKIVVPIHYKTPYTVTPLYPLDPFLKDKQVRKFDTSEFFIETGRLPEKMEVWVPAVPSGS